MSKGINLSPKHGVNPTIPICFWCGKERNEVALLGRIGGKKDLEAPKNAVLDFIPCEECEKNMNKGITLLECTSSPNERCDVQISLGTYPTGRYSVIKREAAERIFDANYVNFDESNKLFVESDIYKELFKDIKGEQ